MRVEIVAAHMGKRQSSPYSTEWSHLAEKKNLAVLATVLFDSGQIDSSYICVKNVGNKKKLFVLREVVSHIKWIGTDHLGIS